MNVEKTVTWSALAAALPALVLAVKATFVYAADMSEVQTQQKAIQEKIDREVEVQQERHTEAKQRDQRLETMLQQIQQMQMQMLQRISE